MLGTFVAFLLTFSLIYYLVQHGMIKRKPSNSQLFHQDGKKEWNLLTIFWVVFKPPEGLVSALFDSEN